MIYFPIYLQEPSASEMSYSRLPSCSRHGIPEVHCYLHTVFRIGTNFWNHQWWWNAWYSHRVPHICDIWRRWSENASQLISFSLKTISISTIIAEILIGPLKCLIDSCTDLNVDSGSCRISKLRLPDHLCTTYNLAPGKRNLYQISFDQTFGKPKFAQIRHEQNGCEKL